MSTSDAGALALRVVGGETATPLYGTPPPAAATTTRATTAREQQDETFGETFKQEEHHGDKRPAEQFSHQTAITQKETHKALILTADELRKDQTSSSGGADIQVQQSSFTSCHVLRLSTNPGIKQSKSFYRLIEPQRVETKDSSFQINGRTSASQTSIEAPSIYRLSEAIPFPAKEKDKVITANCNELEITRDLSRTQAFSNSDFGTHKRNALHRLSFGSQPRTYTGSLTRAESEGNIQDRTKGLADRLQELADPPRTMLSSSVVTVLAPHWSGRLRRSKRFDGTGSSEAQGITQDGTGAAANRGFQQTQSQHGVERGLTGGLGTQMRPPFSDLRRNTVGWSTKSDPLSLESKREMIKTVSLDVNSGRMDNRKIDRGSLSALATSASVSQSQHEQRRNPQTVHQGGHSSSSSKPTTSNVLLSLRRGNIGGKNLNATSPLSSFPSDQNGKLFTTPLSQSFLNSNEQERPKPLLSPSSISYRTTEASPVLSPSPSSLREQSTSDRFIFAPLPVDKNADGKPFAQQSQTINRIQSSLTSSQTSLGKGPSESQQNYRGRSKTLLSETPVSLSRQPPFDSSAQVKTQSFPKRTTLKQTSWWKQVTQESSFPFTPKDTTNNKDKPNTTLLPPSNNNSDMTSSSQPDNKSRGSPVNNNRDNNNTAESVCTGNMNLFMRAQGGTRHLGQRNAGNSPDRDLHRSVKDQYSSNVNNREYPKPPSVPDVLSSSKISRATAQTTLSQPKDPGKYDLTDSSCTANMSELPSALQNPRSSDTPTETSSKYKNNYFPPKPNNTPMPPHSVDSQRFTSTPLSLDFTSTVNGKVHTSQNTSGPQTSKMKSSPSYHSQSVPSQTNIHTSAYTTSTGSLSQKTKFTNNSSATPLGFERSYASIPKPFHPKTVSSLISTVSSVSKKDYSATASNSSSFDTGSHPAATTASSSSLLSPAVTSAITSPTSATVSALLTPPATPVITNPTSETSSPKKEGKFSSSSEKEPKKLEKKKVRRVTWDDSVDLQQSESTAVEKPESSKVQATPQATSKYLRNAPSIFSFLRSSSSSSSVSPPKPKTSSIEVEKPGKYRSLSSDSADLAFREFERNKQRAGDTMIFNQGRQDLPTPRHERTLSVESGTVQCRTSAPLSLPPDFSSGYKVRYSSPPYSTLMSARMTQGETNTRTTRPTLFSQPSQSNYTPNLSVNTDPVSVMTLSTSKPPMSPPRPSLSLSLPLQKKPPKQESPNVEVSETDRASNNNSGDKGQERKLLLVDNRIHIRPPSLQGDKADSSTYVTETLVYSLKSKVDASTATKKTTPNALQHTNNTPVSVETKFSQQSLTGQSKGAAGEPCRHSGQSSSSSSSTESQSRETEDSSKSMKETIMGKSRFFSVDVNNEQNTKRSRFALKKSVSTPNSSLTRSESDRAKSNNKVDQVFSKLKQKLSTRWSTSQAPSVSGSSDVSDVSVESSKIPEETVPEKVMVLNDNLDTQASNRWTQDRYILIPSSAAGNTKVGNQRSSWTEKSSLETDHDMQNACAEQISEKKAPVYLTVHGPTVDQLDLEQDQVDYKATSLSSRDPSPSRSPAFPASFRRSTPSPRSPFSPFSSLSPMSPLSSSDVTDDSVFYSPKLHRRRESSSPCEHGEGISLGVPRKSRASVGPPCVSPGHDNENLASSYADLKYGIEPGKSFSVSSVLSSRPSGPGRISTGSRFMSVGDLSQSAFSCGENSGDFDQWSVKSDWSTVYDFQASEDGRKSYFPSDPGKMRSRSLPRSLTRCLANWSSGDSPQHVNATASKPAHLRSPNMNICQFLWDAEAPPTPPPTPPLSPVSRRMSKPPSLSSPTFPSSPGVLQPGDSQSRGHLPSRGYVSSLSTFDESSDSSSDTTTDDEYYLETDDEGEKETEL